MKRVPSPREEIFWRYVGEDYRSQTCWGDSGDPDGQAEERRGLGMAGESVEFMSTLACRKSPKILNKPGKG